ncbi:MAG: RecQ family ATP-dependent DNA helicase [Bacteroidetes bacterium]|jgi:ATP-dependent DNA helicase RecQ|nr:RecQ family ATP-dependent DNA helicase [Bacteroidota bacterium]
MTALDVLRKYWHYDEFRRGQGEIIDYMMSGGDAIVLMPTGGGKSLCFQVPALLLNGMTIVVSPLISLIKDQVNRLRSVGVPAEALYSGMSVRDITRILNNCLTGKVKLLYISPERLASSIFREFAMNFKVALIVADEAHCISQWGYDFRPQYLNISEIKEIYPKAQMMALTASATQEVVRDICSILKMENAHQFKHSFLRDNLSYVCRKTNDKRRELLNLTHKIGGSGIIYCRSRRATADVAHFLKSNGVSADFYHAGLDNNRLMKVQQLWMTGKTRIIVATTAFGMGIDKPDVRFVAHLTLPPNPEEYYQEAGRGGRDGNKAYAALFYDDQDITELLESVKDNFPDGEQLSLLYHQLALYFNVASGSQKDIFYDFDFAEFCKAYGYSPLWLVKGLKELERQSYILLTESIYTPNQVRILYSKRELYDFQLRNPQYDPLIVVLLRLYGGIMTMPVKINIKMIGEKLRLPENIVYDYLIYLDKAGVVSFEKQRDKPGISFGDFRYPSSSLVFDFQLQERLKERYISRIHAMISIVESPVCRNIPLLHYFGEELLKECGMCDICLENKKSKQEHIDTNQAIQYILDLVESSNSSVSELLSSSFYRENTAQTKAALQFLLQEGKINFVGFKIVKSL